MATYTKVADCFTLDEHPLYGSARLGVRTNKVCVDEEPTREEGTEDIVYVERGYRNYEFSNHLGNVLTVTTDRRTTICDNEDEFVNYEADIISVTDYYPFGSPMAGRTHNQDKYRFGFNGKENDSEVSGEGNTYSFELRTYDARIGRFSSIDPRTGEYPWQTPYAYHRKSPIVQIDYLGGGDHMEKEGPIGPTGGTGSQGPIGPTGTAGSTNPSPVGPDRPLNTLFTPGVTGTPGSDEAARLAKAEQDRITEEKMDIIRYQIYGKEFAEQTGLVWDENLTGNQARNNFINMNLSVTLLRGPMATTETTTPTVRTSSEVSTTVSTTTPLLNQFNSAESLFKYVLPTLSRSTTSGEYIATVTGNGQAVFNVISRFGKLRTGGKAIDLPNGWIITSRIAKDSKLYTIEINTMGTTGKIARAKIRFQ